jgi:hypothetical protein
MDSKVMNGFKGVIILSIFLYLITCGLAFALTADDYFQQGKTNLENESLVNAYNNFQYALALDSNHQGANLFYALTRILMVSKSSDFNTLLDRAGVSSSGRDIFDWTADFTRTPEGRVILPDNAPTGLELQNFLKNNILPEINGALSNLSKVSSSYETKYNWMVENGSGLGNGSNTLTDLTKHWEYNEFAGYKIVIGGAEYTILSNTANTITVSSGTIPLGTYNYEIFEGVEIDYGDVLVFKGSLYLAKGGIYILSAYNLNIDIDTIVSLYNAGTLNFQTHIINTYSELLKLLPGQQLSQAKTILSDAINTFNSAIDFIVAETDPQDDDLFIIDDPVKEQRYRDLLTDLNNALNGATYVREIRDYLNLSEFFDRPKVLRNYLPTFRGQYFIQRDTFPDPTFGGILPNMTSDDLNKMRLIVAPPPVLSLYDDFSGIRINKTKWKEGEFVREVREFNPGDYKLQFKHSSPNPIVVSTFPFYESNGLSFIDPNSVDSIQADVTILENSITNLGYTRARLGGRWYNDGTPGEGMTGDIWAEVSLRRGPSGLFARWGVSKMTNPQGTTWTDIGWGDFAIPINKGTTYTLYIGYDSVANQFIFRIGSEEKKYGTTDGLPAWFGDPHSPWKGIGTRVQIDDTDSSAFICATFDDIYTNGLPYDNFSSPTIDSTKWNAYEFAREISGEKLRSALRNEGCSFANISNSLSFLNPERIHAIKAKVTPMTFNNPDGASPRSRLGGYFYNDGDPSGGISGDVWAEVSIGGQGTTPILFWAVVRMDNSGGTTWTVLAQGSFPVSVTLVSTYDLYIYWDGRAFTFKCNEFEANYVAQRGIFPPHARFKGLQTNIRQTAGINQRAFIESTFDDVMVDASLLPGDANGDGRTTIDEVQKAINQFLGITAAEPCNDLNGNGQVTIDEIQKVINAFLGIT